jgi:hypothetical protein
VLEDDEARALGAREPRLHVFGDGIRGGAGGRLGEAPVGGAI